MWLLVLVMAAVYPVLTVHADHVFERFADDLAGLSNLPCRLLAWRDYNSEPWTVEPDPNTYD
jgi:hypothetical protein